MLLCYLLNTNKKMTEFAPPSKESYIAPAIMAADGFSPLLPANLQAVKGEIPPMPLANPHNTLQATPTFSYGFENGAVNSIGITTKRNRVRNFVGRLTSRRKSDQSSIAEVPAVDSETVSEWEALPKEYAMALKKEDVSNLGGLIKRFRGDVAWKSDVDHTLKNAYSIVRNIGDDLLIGSDPIGEVAVLLDATRSSARPRNFTEIAWDDSTLAIHSESRSEMGIHNSNLLLDSKNLRTFLEESRVELKNPSDTLLFVAINTAAHESGHAILSGVSKLLVSTSSIGNPVNRLAEDERNVATKAYLAAHPEEAITGNWQTDVTTHEERFAEGFGNAVLGKVMDSLGYNDQERQTIISYFLDKAGLSDSLIGQHPIDGLDKFTAFKGMAEVGKEMGVEMSAGAIGYSMPLTLKKMAQQLSDISLLIKSGPKVGYKTTVDPHTWEVSVKTGQSEETKAQIVAQRTLRATRVRK
jgi:hypothetical protein